MTARRRRLVLAVGGVLLALVPPIAALTDQPFYLDLFRRMMIFAIAAVSLDLILGYGGMVSFGHAAYLGIGAYAVAIPAFYGIQSGFVQWPLAMGLSGLVALVIGGIGSIRGAFVASIIIGLVDTLGRTSIPLLLDKVLSPEAAQTAGPALASMLIYILMAGVLFFRPTGLSAARTG